jgi:hypothetical protein
MPAPKPSRRKSRGASAAKTTPPPSEAEATKQQLQQIQITLPHPHIEMLTREADLVGVPRGSLLTMILKKRRGRFHFERPTDAPTYQFKPKDFASMARYTWYVTPDVRKLLDEDTLEMGNVTISMWVVSILNQYTERRVWRSS